MGLAPFTPPRALTDDDSLESFSCGSEHIDTWAHTRARNARKLGTAIVYVSYAVADDRIAGFYTLSSQSITRASVGGGWPARNAPEEIPAILLGMLGVDRKYQGCGLGGDLLVDAVRRARSAATVLGAKLLLIDPLDDEVRKFYQKYGFKDLGSTGKMYARLV